MTEHFEPPDVTRIFNNRALLIIRARMRSSRAEYNVIWIDRYRISTISRYMTICLLESNERSGQHVIVARHKFQQ